MGFMDFLDKLEKGLDNLEKKLDAMEEPLNNLEKKFAPPPKTYSKEELLQKYSNDVNKIWGDAILTLVKRINPKAYKIDSDYTRFGRKEIKQRTEDTYNIIMRLSVSARDEFGSLCFGSFDVSIDLTVNQYSEVLTDKVTVKEH